MAHHPIRREAVSAELWWDFQPGQAVMTREGFAGVVEEVQDGPHPGSEQYIVTLDNGMGGGEYGPTELRAIGNVPTSTATSRIPVVQPTSSTPIDDTLKVASEDYPELAEILVERPPLQNVKRGSKTAASVRCASCDKMLSANGIGWISQGYRVSRRSVDGTPIVGVMGRPDAKGGNPLCRQCCEARVAELKSSLNTPGKTSNVIDRFIDWAAESVPDSVKPRPGNNWSYDWCRFRKDSRCMYPKRLDAEASKQAGYAVWVPEDRGYCPRVDWDSQRACPVGEAGPKSGELTARPDATLSWEDGGQRVAIRSRFDIESEALLVTASTDPSLQWHVTAGWDDIQAKAKRIRSGGGVRILSAATDTVTGEVQGDNGVYQTSLMFAPHTASVAMWECGCPWANYAWARSGRWKKYEGRMCAHALALSYEVQSRGFNGGTVTEDAETPEYDSAVQLPGDNRSTPGPWRVGHLSTTTEMHHASTDGSLAVSPAEAIIRTADVRARIRGAIKTIKALVGLDKVKLDDGSTVPVSEVLYSTYDPRLGLQFQGTHVTAEIDPNDPDEGMRKVEEMCSKGTHTHSGLVIKSVDSGRVLLSQRTPFSDDPEGVYGRWEFPGGSIEDGQTPFESAMREFTEETGLTLPEGWRVDGCYENKNYIAIIVLVPGESWTTNAELLDFETMGIGWFHPDQIDGSDIAREEMDKTEWDMVREAVRHGEVIAWSISRDDGERMQDGLDLAEAQRLVTTLYDPSEYVVTAGADDVVQGLDEQWRSGLTQEDEFAEAKLNDEPEPALPGTDGTSKTATKTFNRMEQQEIIDEGELEGVTAANLDGLDITGTHYEALEAVLSDQDKINPEDLWTAW